MRRLFSQSSKILRTAQFISFQPQARYFTPYNFNGSNNYFIPDHKSFVFQTRDYAQQHDDGSSPPGFIRTFIEMFRREMQEDESIQKDMEEIDSTGTAQALKDTAEATREGSKWLYDQTEGVRDEVSKTVEKTADGIYSTVEVVGKGLDKIAETTIVSAMVDELNREYEMMRKAHFSFRSDYAREKDAEDGIYYNPYTKQFEELGDMDLDEETASVVIVDDPNLEEGQEGELVVQGRLGRIRSGISGIGDKIFRPTAQTEALEMIRQRNDDFKMDLFMGNIENILIPMLLDSYFGDDKEALKRLMTEEAYRMRAWPLIQERKEKEIKFDTKIIKVHHVDLVRTSFVEKTPVILVQFVIQYIHCIKDFDGNIVEGSLTDIRQGAHMLSMIQDTSKKTNDWEIAEWQFGQTLRIPA